MKAAQRFLCFKTITDLFFKKLQSMFLAIVDEHALITKKNQHPNNHFLNPDIFCMKVNVS